MNISAGKYSKKIWEFPVKNSNAQIVEATQER